MGRVSLWDMVEVAARVAGDVSAARRYAAAGGAVAASQSPGEPVEEVRGGGVFRLLAPTGSPRGLVRLGPFPARGVCEVYGVDAGSRRLEGSLVRVYAYGGGVSYFDGCLAIGSYPDVGLYPYVDSGGPLVSLALPVQPSVGDVGWLAYTPLVEPEAVARSLLGFRGRVAGGYWGGYDARVMGEENREVLENRLLGWAVGAVGPGGLVVVDGTLYMTPGLLTHLDALSHAALRGAVTGSTVLRLSYALSYLVNTLARVERVLEGLERGALVVGVVKRVHTSRLLVKALESSGSTPPASYDVELVEQVVARQLQGYGYGVVGPFIALLDFNAAARQLDALLGGVAANLAAGQPFTSRRDYPGLRSILDVYNALRRLGLAAKRMYYVYMKMPLGSPTVFRVEIPEQGELLTVDQTGRYTVNARSLGRVVEEDLGLIGYLVEHHIAPTLAGGGGPLLPEPVRAADRAAKRAAYAVASIWLQALSPVASFDYETLASMGGLVAGGW